MLKTPQSSKNATSKVPSEGEDSVNLNAIAERYSKEGDEELKNRKCEEAKKWEITTKHSDSDENDAREFRDVTTFTTGATACLILSKFEEAIKWCDEGLAIDWNNQTLLELKKESLIKRSELSTKAISTKSRDLKLDIAKKVEVRSFVGRQCLELGDIYTQTRNFGKAVDYYKQYLRICREEKDRFGEADVYGKLGNVFSKVGKFKEAEENYKLQLQFAKEHGDRSQEAQAMENLGTLNLFHSQFGDLRKAIQYLKISWCINREGEQEDQKKKKEGHAYGYLGIVYHRLGDLEMALKYHRQHLKIIMELDEKAEEGKAYGNLGRVYRSQGDFKQAIMYHELQLSIARKETRKVDEAIAHYDLACNFESLADSAREFSVKSSESEAKYLTQAREHYQLCAKLLNDARPRHRGNAQNSIFNDEWKINLFDEYKHVYTDLCRVLSKLHLDSEALLAAEQGRAQALRDFIESRYEIETVEPFSSEQGGTVSDICKDISTNTFFLGIDTDTINVWLLMPGQDVRFEKRPVHSTSNATDFLHTLIRNAYRNCSVIAPLREFHSPLQLDCSSLEGEDSDKSDTSTSHDIETFNKKETEIDSSFLPDLSSMHDDEALYQSDKSKVHGIEMVDQKETTIGEDDPFRTLYDVIFGPIVDHLQGGELVIVPEGPLCLAPFAAFVAPDLRFLCESFRIRIIPSLTSLKLIGQGVHSESGALLVGDPCVQDIVNMEGERLLEQLPFARSEVKMIGRLLNIQPVTGKTATKMEVLDRITSVALIHIAAHASFESGDIALAPNPTRSSQVPREEDFLLTMAEILNVKVRAQLVVLSCCHSGQGEIRAEGVVGIARGFLAAGARSVLVSLWAIDDEATSEFMKSFYEHLGKGRSSSEALNKAMRCLRESDRFSEIKHWAPFVLIGDDVTLKFPDKPCIVAETKVAEDDSPNVSR